MGPHDDDILPPGGRGRLEALEANQRELIRGQARLEERQKRIEQRLDQVHQVLSDILKAIGAAGGLFGRGIRKLMGGS